MLHFIYELAAMGNFPGFIIFNFISFFVYVNKDFIFPLSFMKNYLNSSKFLN